MNDSSEPTQRFAVQGKVYRADAVEMQDVLSRCHRTADRPRCLCMPGGIDMYVAKHQRYTVKRMPQTGNQHHPACPSYEPDGVYSGLGELEGDAVVERDPGHVDVRVDFPWVRMPGRHRSPSEARASQDQVAPRRRMSLRALTHYLFERAGFNRWVPAMAGRRNQAVLRKYLLQAAGDIHVQGVPLLERLYVPEPFNESTQEAAAQRRRQTLAVLRPRDGHAPLALVIGEFKHCERAFQGRRIWIKYMPDAPLLLDERTWAGMERRYGALLEARNADVGSPTRVVLSALIRARREFTYEIDTASLMLASAQWIPLEALYELPLIDALVAQGRRFLKPLRYDARPAVAFANALLLDAGQTPVPLHILSDYLTAEVRREKEKAVAASPCWAWWPAQDMPALPAPASGPSQEAHHSGAEGASRAGPARRP